MKPLSRIASSFILSALLLNIPLMASAQFSVYATKDKGYKYYYSLSPGEKVTDSITIENLDDTPMKVNLYGSDGEQTNQGSYTIKTIEKDQRTVGNWIKFEKNDIELKPKEKLDIPFTIEVPEKTPPSSYVGGIAVATLPSSNNQAGSTKLSVISRIALMAYIDVPGEQKTSFDWSNFDYKVENRGGHTFKLKLKNTGTSALSFKGDIEIFGSPEGNDPNEKITVSTQEVSDLTDAEKVKILNREKNHMQIKETMLFGGDEIELPFTWTKRPLYGSYQAKANLELSQINIKDGTKSTIDKLTKEISFVVIPWNIIFLVLLGLGVIIMAVVVVKVKDSNEMKKASTYEVKEGDTVISIAKELGVPWKKIVQMNKIKPPYEVKPSTLLKVTLPKKK